MWHVALLFELYDTEWTIYNSSYSDIGWTILSYIDRKELFFNWIPFGLPKPDKKLPRSANLDEEIFNAKSSHKDYFDWMERNGINCVEINGKQTTFTKTTWSKLFWALQSDAPFPPSEQNIPLLTCFQQCSSGNWDFYCVVRLAPSKSVHQTPVSLLARQGPRMLYSQATR